MFPLFFQGKDLDGKLDLNPGMLMDKLDSWLDGFLVLLPNLIAASIFAVIGYFVAKWVGKLVNKIVSSRNRNNLGDMLGGLVKWAILIFVFALAATIILPSLSPGDLIAGLGVSSVAIGFAFKDILQNWLAGLLILIRQPFEIGDQIVVNGHEGTVQKIETRATIITTYAGVKIVVPNSEIYTNALNVNTAHQLIRSQYDIGIGYGDNIENAQGIIKQAIEKIEGVDNGKGVEVLPWGLDASWVTLRARWWTKSDRASVVKIHSQVIHAVKEACDEASIDMPFDTYIQLLHDQTESTDGDRSQQREGWPLGDQKNTTPKWKAKEKSHSDNGVA